IIKGLDMGGDDYITKPFHIPILISRIGAVLRRIPEDSGTLLTCGDIALDKASMEVTTDGHAVPLSALEYRLLITLMENKG
ncbi:DNA-binding response regulator, partial [Blautia producta]|nr:DNA-binding response regulator [Blautia producta]